MIIVKIKVYNKNIHDATKMCNLILLLNAAYLKLFINLPQLSFNDVSLVIEPQ